MLARVEKEPSMPRGTELLDGMGLVLPNLNHFDDEQDLRCATVTDVLSTYWDVLGAKIDKYDARLRHKVVHSLREMYDRCRQTDISTACGVYIAAAHIEASHLDDDDARLVRSLTTVHIHRARALTKAKAAA
jgi:hypothetical protein